tara:strand:- start:2984 stop:3331 length:348 start_codon:yes stop_codon:yes gene_type:complete
MPNSNPVCNPIGEVFCDPTELQELAELYPVLCLDSGLEPDPVTLFVAGVLSEVHWVGVSASHNYFLECVNSNDGGYWKLFWEKQPPIIISGSERATDGPFPDLTFPNFSTTDGAC